MYENVQINEATFRVHRPRRVFLGAALGSSAGGTMGSRSSAHLVAHLSNNPVNFDLLYDSGLFDSSQ